MPLKKTVQGPFHHSPTTALQFISAQERLEDSGTLLYPSITFCPKYIWQVISPGISHSCCTLRTCRSSPGSWSSSTTTSPWTSTTSSSLPSPTSGLGRRCCLLCHVEPCNDAMPRCSASCLTRTRSLTSHSPVTRWAAPRRANLAPSPSSTK